LQEGDRGAEEADVTKESVRVDFERLDEADRADDDGRDERRSTEELAEREAGGVRAHGRERAEHVRTAVPEREKRHARDVLVQPEHVGDRAEVRAEEVGGGDAKRGEDEDEPDNEAGEGKGTKGGRGAEVELGVRDAENGV
jgi:hypothetical protein